MIETSGTIVVCRPQQVREAATVLSCCEPGEFTPLIVLEPPPIPEGQYRDLFAAYVEARDRRDEITGTAMARMESIDPIQLMKLSIEVDAKAESLTPFRSWAKHNRFLSTWLQRIAPARAIFLFEAAPEELRIIEPMPRSRIGEERFAVIPEGIQWLYFVAATSTAASNPKCNYYEGLSGLADLAYNLVRGKRVGDEGIGVGGDDLLPWFAALSCALKTGQALRPVDAGNSSHPLGNPANYETNEAAVIEVTNDATRLLGVLYAHAHGAKPVFYGEPDIGKIEDARSAIERQQEESTKDLRYISAHSATGIKLPQLNLAEQTALKSIAVVSSAGVEPFEPKRFLDKLRRLLHGSYLSSPLQNLEQAVSASVPDSVISEVGDREVTAFTAGVPYNFVNKNGADWSKRAIGHISGDTSLLVYENLIPTEDDQGVGFNLLFDPGYITTSETHDVLDELQHRVSHSVLLSGEGGTSLSLIHMSQTLPLEIVFFNTHGSDNAILLRDMVLPAFKLVQRVTLRSRPIVFNNSCLSWVGVGREFIRTGARGYIGTLWSVDQVQAANLARIAMQRMIQQKMPASRAMRETGVDAQTERAYIFVGPAHAALNADSTVGDERSRLIRSAGMLFECSTTWLELAGGNLQAPFISPVIKILLSEAEWLCNELDRRHPEAGLDRLVLLIEELRLRVDLPIDEAMGNKIAEIVRRSQTMIDSIKADAKSIDEQRVDLSQLTARWYLIIGKPDLALPLLNQSIDASKKIQQSPGPQFLELSDALKSLGRNQEALDAAVKAKEAFTNADGKMDKKAAVGVLGRLSQLSTWLKKFDVALQYAVDGCAAAAELDDLREQTMFKGDEARALLSLGRADDARRASKEMSSLARRAHDDKLEVGAYGVEVQMLMAQQKWPLALKKIDVGLKQARALNFYDEVGDFLFDQSKAREAKKDLYGSLDSLREAAAVFASLGRLAKFAAVIESASRITAGLNSWQARVAMVGMELNVMDRVDPRLRVELCSDAVSTLKEGLIASGLAASKKPLRELSEAASRELSSRGSNVSPQVVFVTRVIEMLSARTSGRVEDARQAASSLDQLSAGGFSFAKFLQDDMFRDV